MSWDATRRAVRSLEARLDSALSTASSTSGDLQTSLSAASSIPALLVDLRSANGQLSVALGSNPTPAQMAAVRRHDEVLGEYEREWSVVEGRRGRRDVLEGVRGDISAYKTRHGTEEGELLHERDRIANSHNMIDRSLDQAYATRGSLAQQRGILSGATSRLQSSAAQIPALNTLITQIRRRRKRDQIIMGAVVAGCTVLLLMYLFS